MNFISLGQHAEVVSAVIGAILAIVAFWRWGWPAARCAWGRVRAVWSALEQLPGIVHSLSAEDPEGVPAKFDRLFSQGETRGAQLAEHGASLARVDKKIDGVANTQRAMMNTNPRVAAFEADANGHYTTVNRTFVLWSGLPPTELLGMKWINAVHREDRHRVREEWRSAIAESRRFECRFRLVNATSQATKEVDASADPIPEDAVPCERWYGTMSAAQPGILA